MIGLTGPVISMKVCQQIFLKEIIGRLFAQLSESLQLYCLKDPPQLLGRSHGERRRQGGYFRNRVEWGATGKGQEGTF